MNVKKALFTVTALLISFAVFTTSAVSYVTASAVKKPAKVSKRSIESLSSTSIKIKWKKVKKAKGYQIKISANKKFKKARTINSVKTFKTIKKLKRNTKYYIKIRAYTKSGSKKVYGKWNRALSFNMPEKVKKISKKTSKKITVSSTEKNPSAGNQTADKSHTHKWIPIKKKYPIYEYHIIDPYTDNDLTEDYQQSDKTTDIYTFLRNNYEKNAAEHKDDMKITEGKLVIVDYKEVTGGYYYDCNICGEGERKDIKISYKSVDTRTEEQKKQKITELVNQIRSANGKSLLSENKIVMNCAQLKAEDFADNKYFSHTSPKYGDAEFMLKNEFGVDSNFIGENIAAGEETPEKAVDGWISSEMKRTSILDDEVTQIGVGYVNCDSGVSVNGKTHHDFWVEIFTGDLKLIEEQ